MPRICPLSTPVVLAKSSLKVPCTHLFVSWEKQQQLSRVSNAGGVDPTHWKDTALVKTPPSLQTLLQTSSCTHFVAVWVRPWSIKWSLEVCGSLGGTEQS